MDKSIERIIRRALEEARAKGRDNLVGISLWAVGGLFLAAAWFLANPWTWEWCVFVGFATFALLLGAISAIEKWTDARGFWDK